MPRRSLAETTLRLVAARHGATVTQVGTTGGNHRFAVLTKAGQRRKVFFGSTPSDHRGHLNPASDVRKAIKGMTGAPRR
jgi:hypothetical protein